MDFLWDTLGFAAKGFVIFLTTVVTVTVVLALVRRRQGPRPRLEVRQLNERFEALGDALRAAVLGPKAFKQHLQQRKRARKGTPATKPTVYVVDFEGDVLASSVVSLREEVTAILAVASAQDEVVVRLESPGGAVPHYGLAAAQLVRLREKQLKVTVCIDRMAASGGYMMACVADRVVAAPFSIIGSIGVVVQIPNLNRFLKKHDVDMEEMTAGEFKRTISVLGEITEKGRQKLKDQLEETHQLFKGFVKTHRPQLDIDAVATGEYWLARRAAELGLVDQLSTSDDYLLGRVQDATVLQVSYKPARGLRERLGRAAVHALDRALIAALSRAKSLELT